MVLNIPYVDAMGKAPLKRISSPVKTPGFLFHFRFGNLELNRICIFYRKVETPENRPIVPKGKADRLSTIHFCRGTCGFSGRHQQKTKPI